jgi:hypothetical protein
VTDRPPTNALDLLASLAERVADLERAGRRTRIDVRDTEGVLRARLGDIDGTGRYGLRVWNSSGVLVHDHTAT